MLENKNILIIEDDKDSRELLKIYLTKWNYNVFEASKPFAALELIKTHSIQMALIDWVLDETSGIEICNLIRNKFRDNYVYIIIITGQKTRRDVVEALSQGADDYLMKPFNFEELKVRIKAGERILTYQNNLKDCYDKLYEASIKDPLTGTFNRQTILERLNSEFERAKRLNDDLSVIMSDIDFFKRVNDSYGHLVGDSVLKHIGKILKKSIRKYDTVGRYGGEEFLIILPHTSIKVAKNIAERVRQSLKNEVFIIKNFSIPITMSFGISHISRASNSSLLLQQADQMLYEAKRRGRNKVVAIDEIKDYTIII